MFEIVVLMQPPDYQRGGVFGIAPRAHSAAPLSLPPKRHLRTHETSNAHPEELPNKALQLTIASVGLQPPSSARS